MKKLIILSLIGLSNIILAQKLSVEQIEKSNDVMQIAKFIKENPNNPKTPLLKRKLATLMSITPANTPEKKTTTTNLPTKNKTSNNKNVDVLNHIFSNDPNKKDAYVSIKNNSKCNIVMKFVGKKNYSLTIPPMNNNFLLVEKGRYSLSSNICGSEYHSVKDLNKDIEIILGN